MMTASLPLHQAAITASNLYRVRMKRRSFLAGGAAAAASSAMAGLACAQSTHRLVRRSWDLLRAADRYTIRLNGPAVVVDCYGAGDGAGEDVSEKPPAATGAWPFERAAMILGGPERRPVSWRVAVWHRPDPLALRIALSGVEAPLEAELLFELDASTGLLSRNTTIHHRGAGPDIDITATLAFWYGIHEPIDDVRCLEGAWAQETQIRHSDGTTPLVLESRAGKTGFAFQPYAALGSKTSTYLCQIFWSGNWALRIEPSPDGTAVFGGLSDWQFQCRLTAGGDKTLRLPTVLFGRFDGDLNGRNPASARLPAQASS